MMSHRSHMPNIIYIYICIFLKNLEIGNDIAKDTMIFIWPLTFLGAFVGTNGEGEKIIF